MAAGDEVKLESPLRRRVMVKGNVAIVKLISGGPGDADGGLILQGADQCYELAERLVEAGDRIVANSQESFLAWNERQGRH
jgi:hypothetical protein